MAHRPRSRPHRHEAQGAERSRPPAAPSRLATPRLATLPPLALAAALSAPVAQAQVPDDLVSAPGDVLYQASCANCHGADGRGADPALLAFEEEVPDFTDCDFAAREPDADRTAVAYEGGPVWGSAR